MNGEIKKLLLWSQKYIKADMIYIAKGGLWNTFEFTISSVVSLALLVAFANLLPKETYGSYKYIMSLAGSLGFLTLTGMNTAVIQAVAKGYYGSLVYAVKTQLKWNLLFTSVIFGIGIYYLYQENNIFGISILILGVIYPLTIAFRTYGSFLVGKKEFKKSNIYALITNIIYAVAMIITLLFSKNIIALVSIHALTNFLPSLYFYSKIKKEYQIKELTPEQKGDLLKYGSHLSIVNIFSTLSQYIDKIVIFQFLGPAQLAIYAFALAIPDRIKGFLKAFTGIFLPKLSEKTIGEIKPNFYKRSFQSFAIGGVIGVIYIISAPFFFKIFLPKYLDSVFYSQLIAISFAFIAPAIYMSSVFRSQKMIKTIYLSSVGAHISRIVLFVILGTTFGILGVIIASLLVYFIGLFYNFILWNIEIQKRKIKKVSDVSRDIEPNPLAE